MTNLYKPLSDLNTEDVITLKSFGESKNGQYGPYYPNCQVTVNGRDMGWEISGPKKTELMQAGFVEGNTFKVSKWREGEKKGYRFKAPDPKNPYSQPESSRDEEIIEKHHPGELGKSFYPPMPPPTQEHVNELPPNDEPDWDAIAEGKVRHGVSLAFIEKGERLHSNKDTINGWVDFIMTGK